MRWPKMTRERFVILCLTQAAGGWIFLFCFIPRWNREDQREEERENEPA